MKKAIVLLSGGLDSTVTIHLAKSQGFDVYALSFNYGQKHNKELECAIKTAKSICAKDHKIIDLKLDLWGGSSLTDNSMNIEDGNISTNEIPLTYVPARNMVFLSIAASYAEAIGSQDIFIGVSQVDYSGYVDCREVFIKSMENTINLGTVMGAEMNKKIKIHAPFLFKTKSEEIIIGEELGVDWSNTWSCYRGGVSPCGKCDSCLLRKKAFEEAGVTDTSLI